MAEFVDRYDISDLGWEVMTDTGYHPVAAIGKTVPYQTWTVLTVSHELKCADCHVLILDTGQMAYAKDLQFGMTLLTESGPELVLRVYPPGSEIINEGDDVFDFGEGTPEFTPMEASPMYELQVSSDDHRYYTSGILSHNSIVLSNLAANMSINGYNVLMISLEMAVYKIYRRVGSNLLDIPISQYASVAANSDMLGEYIRNLKARCSTELIPPGMLRAKKMNRATVSDIQGYKRRVEQEYGIKIHAVVLDYATELANAYGVTSDSMYMFHKQNTDDMFCMAGEEELAFISAHQLKVAEAIKDDIYLGSAAESSGITQRPDNIIGIIQTPDMKLNNRYHFKNLKSRDGEFKDYRIELGIDYNHMRLLEQSQMISPGQYIPV